MSLFSTSTGLDKWPCVKFQYVDFSRLLLATSTDTSLTECTYRLGYDDDGGDCRGNPDVAAMVTDATTSLVDIDDVDMYADIVEALNSQREERAVNTSKRKWQRKMRNTHSSPSMLFR